mmetsp:Transcript_91907/g.274233  ORF Transcript_91907/g.274233 Transcript_91907/m.274233 type:complete len:382 (-) Transcript_91907:91-1236(-)
MLTVLDYSCPVAQKIQKMELASQAAREPMLKRREQSAMLPVESETIQVAGCKIEVWNDEFFSRLRRFHGVPDDFLNVDKENSVDLTKPRKEGKLGKGGDKQYISSDAKYIIKSATGDDHKSLLLRAEAYVERLLSGNSLIVPIYLHFRDPTTKKAYIVMANLTEPGVKWDEKYDLKGCADDKTVMRNGKMVEPVHRRFYRVDMWCRCMWTAKRVHYHDGKVRARALNFDFPRGQRDEIVRIIRDDAQWLMDQGLMDYSLFLAVRRVPKSQVPPAMLYQRTMANGTGTVGAAPPAVRQWAMLDGETVVFVTLSIIDFLQPWTAAKKVARCIKSLEFNKATIPPPDYAARFKRHFAERFRGVERMKALGPVDVAAANHGATAA